MVDIGFTVQFSFTVNPRIKQFCKIKLFLESDYKCNREQWKLFFFSMAQQNFKTHRDFFFISVIFFLNTSQTNIKKHATQWSINHQNVITQKVTNVFYKYSFSPHLVGENIFYSCFEHPASTILPSQSAVEEIYAAAWTDVLDITDGDHIYCLTMMDSFCQPGSVSFCVLHFHPDTPAVTKLVQVCLTPQLQDGTEGFTIFPVKLSHLKGSFT